MRPHEQHRANARKKLRFHVVTVSTSRYARRAQHVEDESGDSAERIITSEGHFIGKRTLISDDVKMIGSSLRNFLAGTADVLLLIGGTGLSKRDLTIETVRPHFEKELDGFGELLRSKSFEDIGPAAMLSRATAGVIRGKLIFCLPGSPDAVKKALSLVISELPHAVLIAKS